jgi:hypothetical protein
MRYVIEDYSRGRPAGSPWKYYGEAKSMQVTNRILPAEHFSVADQQGISANICTRLNSGRFKDE